jgi:hypothetical protein
MDVVNLGLTASVKQSLNNLIAKGICAAGMGASTTIIVCENLAGFGTGYFNGKYYIQVIKNNNAVGIAPECEYRKITDYVSATGTFTTKAFSANVEASDEIIVIHSKLVDYQFVAYKTAGAFNWTVPADVNFVDIMVGGGGGGGGGGGSGRNTAGTAGNNGTDGSIGGISSFTNSVSAGGGSIGKKGFAGTAGAQGEGSDVGTDSTIDGFPPTIGLAGKKGAVGRDGEYDGNGMVSADGFASANLTVGTGSDNTGGAGGNGGNSLGAGGKGGDGGIASSMGGSGSVGVFGGGGGGGGGGNGSTFYGGGAGGGGAGSCEFIRNYLVTPGSIIALVVGAAGAGGNGGASSGAGSYAGGNGALGTLGYILIRYRQEVLTL